MIMQRAISRRRWCPYDSVPAGRFATDVSPIRSSHGRAFERFLLGTAIRGRREQAGQQPRLHLRCCATSRFSTTVSDLNRRMFWNVRAGLQRDLVARQPANRVAVEHDVAAGRLGSRRRS